MKNIIKSKILYVCILLMSFSLIVTSCSNKEGVQDAIQKNENNSSTTKGNSEELIFIEREIMASHDPNLYPGSNHYLKNGAGETLFKIDTDGTVKPFLAKGSEKKDNHTWSILLRPEAKFWSGEKVTAQSVIDSLERSRETNIKAGPFLDGLSFKAIEEDTIEVKTERENLDVPLNLAYMELCIINASKEHDSVETMDMTGMYKTVLFEPKNQMVLEINENYYGKKPTIKKIIHKEITDPEARTLAMLSGNADIVMHISNESINQLKENKDITLHTVPAANTQTIYLNLDKPELKDVKVRQALSWALDREELVLLGSEGLSIPLTTWLSSNPKYKEARNEVYNEYDLEKAGQLLDEAGWKLGQDNIRTKDGEPLKIKLMTWGQDKALGESIQNQWSKLGVQAEVQHGDYSLIETAREKGDWHASIEAWQTYGDEYALLSGQFLPEGGANYGNFNDEEIIVLIKSILKANNEEEKHKITLEANRKVAEQAPGIYMYPRVETTATKASLKGFVGHFRQLENAINADLKFE